MTVDGVWHWHLPISKYPMSMPFGATCSSMKRKASWGVVAGGRPVVLALVPTIGFPDVRMRERRAEWSGTRRAIDWLTAIGG